MERPKPATVAQAGRVKREAAGTPAHRLQAGREATLSAELVERARRAAQAAALVDPLVGTSLTPSSFLQASTSARRSPVLGWECSDASVSSVDLGTASPL